MTNLPKRTIPISRPDIGDKEKAAVVEVMESGMLVQGPRVAAFEKDFASVVGTKHAIATSSGTTALHTSLMAHGITAGDEVITTAFTFVASVNTIVYTGATPIFADIHEDTFCIDCDHLESLITPRTKAIMPIHLYGLSCDMTRIVEIAERHGLVIVEDCAQSIGASHRGKVTGSFGTGCFSLYATKNVMSGEGGMITTDDDGIADRCRLLRGHGMRKRYYHEILGYNFRMMDLVAAIGHVQLGRLDEFTSKRRHNAAYLAKNITRVVNPTDGGDPLSHVWHQYTVRITDPVVPGEETPRDRAVRTLNEAGIGCGVFYPVPATKQEHLVAMGYDHAHIPVTDHVTEQVFSIPVHPKLSQDDLEYIVEVVNSL